MDFIFDFLINIDSHLLAIVQNYHEWTYLLLFIVIFCETGLVVTPFLPGDSLLFIAGAISAHPDVTINVHLIAIIVIVAAIAGDASNYFIGYFFGDKLSQKSNSRFFKPAYFEKTHNFYSRYGGKTIVIARFIPIVRTFAPFVAGIGKMNYLHFTTYNILGGVFWSIIFCYTGYFFGDMPFMQQNIELLLVAIIFISLLPAIIEIVRAKLNNTKKQPD
ncbi:MAG: DedA family protein [Muribaculaceae bacterium]|nr:DedA family protein [Muribaculaceae bacterium]